MVRSYCLTPRPIQRPIENGLKRIIWRCSHYTDTDDNTNSHWVLCKYIGIFVSLGLYVCLGVGQCKHTINFVSGEQGLKEMRVYSPACTAATAAACTAAAARVFWRVRGVSNVIGRLSASRPDDRERDERVLGPPLNSGLVTFTI